MKETWFFPIVGHAGDGPIDALNIWIENHASKYKVTDDLPS